MKGEGEESTAEIGLVGFFCNLFLISLARGKRRKNSNSERDIQLNKKQGELHFQV